MGQENRSGIQKTGQEPIPHNPIPATPPTIPLQSPAAKNRECKSCPVPLSALLLPALSHYPTLPLSLSRPLSAFRYPLFPFTPIPARKRKGGQSILRKNMYAVRSIQDGPVFLWQLMVRQPCPHQSHSQYMFQGHRSTFWNNVQHTPCDQKGLLGCRVVAGELPAHPLYLMFADMSCHIMPPERIDTVASSTSPAAAQAPKV